MKKILTAVIAATVVVAMLAVSVCATATPISDPLWALTDGTTADMYTINEDGSVSISYRQSGVTWANCGIAFDASGFGSSYTVEVEYKHPARVDGCIQGCPAIAIASSGVTSWLDGLAIKLVDYSNHATPSVAELGLCWELYNPVTTPVATKDGVTYPDANQVYLGWNTFKAVVDGGKASFFINDVEILHEYTFTSAGTKVVLGTNGDCGDPAAQMSSFRNFKVSAQGKTDYTAFTEAGGGPADAIDVIAVSAVAIFALAGAAFVIKARKA